MNDAFLDYLEDILEAMAKAEELLEDATFEEFESDYRINFAVVRALEIIGEATKPYPPNFARNTEIFPGAKWPACATESSMNTTTSICASFGRPSNGAYRKCNPN